MAQREFLQVDPRTLHVPPSRVQGADPGKLSRQLSKFGTTMRGMPPLEVIRGKDGVFQILDGVTRATRVARFLPGQLVTVEVTQNLPHVSFARFLTIGDLLP